MKSSLKIRLAFGMLSAASWQPYAYSRPAVEVQPLRLNIHLYNQSGASPRTLDQAMKEAARILAATGMKIVWQSGPADAPEANISDQHAAGSQSGKPDVRDYLVVKILRSFPDSSLPGALGYSLPDARFGSHAMIFYNRIERVTASGDIDLATMLGHAMAHEIGHVLLGSTEHSPDGIMKARWGRADYQNAAKGYIKFTPLQCKAIRERAAIRLSGKSGE
ncbi:MAG: hypothetical protein JOY54_18375 [Acidobacteriaceae bacterium]|nr:hypothetical protein [Acidobacteriaceae bacterium]